ncbi:MAG TPA: ATP-binding protein [Thermoanaerobaculia bacterium]|nr:ATP-binding protein [Thermoanaerobaculia bacterium]
MGNQERREDDPPGGRGEDRLLRQNRVLVELARSRTARDAGLDAALAEITRAAAETIGSERVSVWFYNESRSAIRCAVLYERSTGRCSQGMELAAARYPSYFAALETERTVAAHDARTDPRTREFTDTYLTPLGITSMLDAPIRVGGQMIGVVCHEHVGPARHWTEDEASFAGSIADAVSLACEESERKGTETALRESEERYRRIVETAREAIWSVDAGARTTYANPRFAEMLGYTVDEILGRNAFDFIHPDHKDDSREQWERRRRGLRDRQELLLIRRDGSPLWVASSSTPVYDGEGRFAGAVTMMTDITDLKHAEAEREEILARERTARAEAETANRLKDEFLATVSHELRTPLSAMIGWVHLLRVGGLDAATTERALATIDRNIRAQAQIIDEILDVSRIIRGSLTLSLQPVDLAALLHQVVESVRPAAQSKGIGVHTTVDPTVTPVNGDPDRLQQVVWNLLSNALKFTPGGGRVEVRLERQEAGLRLSVADTGQGIAPEFLPHVFERFRQADSSTTRVHGGLGLGLSIVRHLVELHGGTVTAESAGVDRGARFTVTLPAALPALDPMDAEPAQEDRPRPPLAGRRLLVVDDEPDTREALGFLLQRAGAVVETASSAREALAAIERSRPHVLIADIGMPGEDGYALIRQVRTLAPERGGSIPAVALTAYARPEDRERALAEGYQEHVAKPVEPETLIELLAGL